MRLPSMLLSLMLLVLSAATQAQLPQIGSCSYADSSGPDRLALMTNGTYVSEKTTFFRQRQGFGPVFNPMRRDPSGMMYIQLSSIDPNNGYFIDWAGAMVAVNMYQGANQIGQCKFNPGYPPPNPWLHAYRPLPRGGSFVRGAETLTSTTRYIPRRFEQPGASITAPRLVRESEALSCANNSRAKNGKLQNDKFKQCMINEMLGQKERAFYKCAREAKDDDGKMALCTLAALGGSQEQRDIAKVSDCYLQHGKNYKAYPLCMAQDSFSEDQARLVNCMQQESEQGDISVYGTAVCYGMGSLDLTPEQQIAMECAMGSGGEPTAFVTCTGGRLTSRELSKCFTHGVGGKNGCFGPNNDIVKALDNLSNEFARHFGPNNDVVKTFRNAANDLTQGPGKNNDVVKTFRNAANDLTHGPGKNNDLRKAAESILPGFKW